MPYNSKQDAVTKLLPGYHVVGEKTVVSKLTNPDAGRPGQAATIDGPTTIMLSVQGPNGEPDEIEVKEVGNNPNTKGGVGYDVVTGPKSAPAKTASALGDLQFLDKDFQPTTDPSKRAFVRDPKAAPGTQPYKIEPGTELGDPSTWTAIHENPTDATSRVIGLFDPKAQKVAASVTAAPGAKPSDPSNWTPVYRKPGDTASGVVGQWDPTNNELHAVSQTPDGKQVVITDTGIYVVDKESGKTTLSQSIDKTQPLSVFTHPDGSIYMVDPNEKDPTKKLSKLQGQQPPQTMVQQTPGGAVTLVYDPDAKSYKLPPGVTMPASVDAPGSAALEYIIYRSGDGKETFKSKNPNWTGYPQPTAPPTDTVSKTVPRWNKDKGVWEDVPNTQRLVASDALRAMAQQVTGQIISGDISEDEAYKLLTAANAKMANDIASQNAALSAASTALSAGAQGAQTGAGLLNQRVQSGASMLGNVLSLAGQSHLRGLPTGTGQALMSDIQGFATNLGGGQDVYDTAVRLVHAADPSAPNELTAKATAFITQVLNKQTEQNGGIPPPAVQVTQQLKQNLQQNQGGMTAPVTVQSAGMQQPTAVAQGFVAPPAQLPGQNYGAGLGYTGGVAPSSYGFTPPGGSSYSYGGPVPWAGAVPQPLPQGFVAPPAVTVPMPGRLT